MELARINDQNSWWKFGGEFHRHDNDLKKLRSQWTEFERRPLPLRPNEVLTLLGPRQVGKTALIKQTIANLLQHSGGLFPNRTISPRSVFYLSCDTLTSGSRRELQHALTHFTSISQEVQRRFVFLDEIGRVDGWQIELKELMDAGILQDTTVVVTGSFVPGLHKFSELFPGRPIRQCWVPPLTFRAFIRDIAKQLGITGFRNEGIDACFKLADALRHPGASPDSPARLENIVRSLSPFESELLFFWDIYLRTGGFPHAVNSYCARRFAGGESSLAPPPEVFATYAKVGVDDLIRLNRPERILRQIIHGILHSTGSRVSLNSFAKSTEEGLTHVTVGEYLDLLDQSLVLRTCLSCDPKAKAIRPKANRKVYLADPFIHYSLWSWLEGQEGPAVVDRLLQDEILTSRIVELVTAQHLTLSGIIPFRREPVTFLWFYYDARQEIDFVYRSTADSLLGIEVKYQGTATTSDMPHVKSIDREYLLTKQSTDLAWERGMMIPCSVFLAALESSGHCV